MDPKNKISKYISPSSDSQHASFIFQHSISAIISLEKENILCIGCFDGHVMFYNLEHGRITSTFKSGSLKTEHIEFLPLHNVIVFSNSNKAVTIWDLTKNQLLVTLHSSFSNTGKSISTIQYYEGFFYCLNTVGDLLYFKLPTNTIHKSNLKIKAGIKDDGFGIPVQPKNKKPNCIEKITLEIDIKLDFIEQQNGILYLVNKSGYLVVIKIEQIIMWIENNNHKLELLYYQRTAELISCFKIVNGQIWFATYEGLIVYTLLESGEIDHKIPKSCIIETYTDKEEKGRISKMEFFNEVMICLLNNGILVVYNIKSKTKQQCIKRKDNKAITDFCLNKINNTMFVVLENKEIIEFHL